MFDVGGIVFYGSPSVSTISLTCRMNFSEVKQHLQASEKRFDAGEYISEEQMEELFNSLR